MHARAKVQTEALRAPSGATSPASPVSKPAASSPTAPSVGAGRPAPRLTCASRRPRGPGNGCICHSGGDGRAPRQPSSIGPSCAPPRPPAAASLASASVPMTIGGVCAILAHHSPSFADASGLSREQSAVLSAACDKGSGKAKRAGQEGTAGALMVPHPSSWLARARAGRSPAADEGRSRPLSPRPALEASWMAPTTAG